MPLQILSATSGQPAKHAVTINWRNQQLLGTRYMSKAGAENDCSIGMIILVGGPQYRIGSHQQFVRLATRVALQDVAVLAFDFAGMGDSTGEFTHYSATGLQIRAAIDKLISDCPTVERIVLFGLCDGASAAMFYAPNDHRVVGLVLANPWLEPNQRHAKLRIRSYYLKRILSSTFWRSLVNREINVFNSMVTLVHRITTTFSGGEYSMARSDSTRLALLLAQYRGSGLIIIANDDPTGNDFVDHVTSVEDWQAALSPERFSWLTVDDADHTFTDREHEELLFGRTIDFLVSLKKEAGETGKLRH